MAAIRPLRTLPLVQKSRILTERFLTDNLGLLRDRRSQLLRIGGDFRRKDHELRQPTTLGARHLIIHSKLYV
jgi:hypothetical protein